MSLVCAAPTAYATKIHRRPVCETRLQEYLTAHGISYDKFARTLGVNPLSVSHMANGRVIPRLVVAFKIEYVTAGAVPATSWLESQIGKELWASFTRGMSRER